MVKRPSLEWLTIGQAAKYLGVSRDTLRRWESREKLKSYRTPGGRRRYTMYDLELAVRRPQKASSPTPKPLKQLVTASQPIQTSATEPPQSKIEIQKTAQTPTKIRFHNAILGTLQILLLAAIIGLLILTTLSGVGEGLITRLKTGEKIINPVSEISSPSK